MALTIRSMTLAAGGMMSMMVVSDRASAQEATRRGAPEKGTWGAEASVGGFSNTIDQSAALLRFVSPQTALLGSLSFSRTSTDAGTSGASTAFTSSALPDGSTRRERLQ